MREQLGNDGSIRLRLLATTDLHMHLTGWDYARDAPLPAGGLTRIATLIADARRKAAALGAHVLLFDNGDGFQGSALGDVVDDAAMHPLLMAFGALGYDAVGLGNHDFDFGIERLEKWLARAPCPVVCSNLQRIEPGLLPQVAGHTVLRAGPLCVGVVAAVPPQTALWNAERMRGRIGIGDITDTIESGAAALRARGCDIVVALAHSGLGQGERRAGQEDAVHPVAALAGVDAVFGGHRHEPFSGRLKPDGTPVALAAHNGQSLAQIDLDLDRGGTGGWVVSGAAARLIQATAEVPEEAGLTQALAPLHQAARTRMAQPVARTGAPMHSYFSMVHPDAHLRLLAEAQRVAFAHSGVTTDLPVLSAVAPGKCGGRGGPAHYADVPAGEVLQRHLEDMVVFPNLLRAVVLSGRELREWLEMAASVFRRVEPGARAAPLLDPDWPAHGFDTVFGLRYAIDLGQPARYRPDGTLADAAHSRVTGLDLADDGRFVVLTTDYRANGGGNVPALRGAERLDLPDLPLRAALVEALDRVPSGPDPWRFAPMPGTSVLLPTGPGARAHLGDIARYAPQMRGTDAQGFLRVELQL